MTEHIHLVALRKHLIEGKSDSSSSLSDLWQEYRGQVEHKISVEFTSASTTTTTIAPPPQYASVSARSQPMSVREQFQQATSNSSRLMMLSPPQRRSPLASSSSTPNNNNDNDNNSNNSSSAPPLPAAITSASADSIRSLQQDVALLREQLREAGVASEEKEISPFTHSLLIKVRSK